MANYNPLFASYITREGGLPVDKRVALTAAAMVIRGPLALAPALVAVQRQRDRDSSDVAGPDEPIGPVGPRLVEVPDLVGQPVDDVRGRLKFLGLTADLSLHESAEDEKGRVLDQTQPPMIGERVEVGTKIALKVGAGERKRDDASEDCAAAIGRLGSDVEELRSKVDQVIEMLQKRDRAAAVAAAPAAPSGDRKPTSSG